MDIRLGVICCGLILAAFYAIYKEITCTVDDNKDHGLPVRIDATYISQSPNTFYGMYLYYDEDHTWRYKMRTLEEANVILQLYGVRTKLPARYDSLGYNTLVQIAKETDGKVVFEFNDDFDVS